MKPLSKPATVASVGPAERTPGSRSAQTPRKAAKMSAQKDFYRPCLQQVMPVLLFLLAFLHLLGVYYVLYGGNVWSDWNLRHFACVTMTIHCFAVHRAHLTETMRKAEYLSKMASGSLFARFSALFNHYIVLFTNFALIMQAVPSAYFTNGAVSYSAFSSINWLCLVCIVNTCWVWKFHENAKVLVSSLQRGKERKWYTRLLRFFEMAQSPDLAVILSLSAAAGEAFILTFLCTISPVWSFYSMPDVQFVYLSMDINFLVLSALFTFTILCVYHDYLGNRLSYLLRLQRMARERALTAEKSHAASVSAVVTDVSPIVRGLDQLRWLMELDVASMGDDYSNPRCSIFVSCSLLALWLLSVVHVMVLLFVADARLSLALALLCLALPWSIVLLQHGLYDESRSEAVQELYSLQNTEPDPQAKALLMDLPELQSMDDLQQKLEVVQQEITRVEALIRPIASVKSQAATASRADSSATTSKPNDKPTEGTLKHRKSHDGHGKSGIRRNSK